MKGKQNMAIYNKVVTQVNKIFTKKHGSHWYIKDTFDRVFFYGHYGDGKYRLSKTYRQNCILKALWEFPELHGVKEISKEEAQKYVPACVKEFEDFRNSYVKKYFGTWEKMEKHYEEVQKAIEARSAAREYETIEISLLK